MTYAKSSDEMEGVITGANYVKPEDPFALSKPTCSKCNRPLHVKESIELKVCAPCRGKGINFNNRDYRFGDNFREDTLQMIKPGELL